MIRKAVFLDRDGTVSRYTEYCRRPQDFELQPDAGAAIRRLNEVGLLVVLVTNQSAIGRGWLTLETLQRIHEKMHRQLRRQGARVDAVYVCPHHPADGCGCRKPEVGLLLQAVSEWQIDLSSSYVVGDRWLDIASGHAAGCTSVLVCSGHPQEPGHEVRPDFEAQTLSEAVAWIVSQESAIVERNRSCGV